MSNFLRIETNWLGNLNGRGIEGAFFADIGLAIDEQYLTRLEDMTANTVRNHVRGDAYQLAIWFAANWWRLRWEPELANGLESADWRMSHSIAGVGGGFVWPNIIFASDGDFISIKSHQSDLGNEVEAIRYLNQSQRQIPSTSFEQSIDTFMEGVLTRLQVYGLSNESLVQLWEEIRAERSDLTVSEYRKLEAICGFDPDESPEGMIQNLIEQKSKLGQSAIAELAAHWRQTCLENVKIMDQVINAEGLNQQGISAKFPRLTNTPEPFENEPPWQLASRYAKLARQSWGLGDTPIDDRTFSDLLEASSRLLESGSMSTVPLSFALNEAEQGTCSLFLYNKRKEGKRFTLARLIGDSLRHSTPERLSPVTNARTYRQQFQRAFGQEFLCPFDALKDRLGTALADDENISEAAEYFQVSPLLVKTTLVNKGELDRDALVKA